MSVSPRNRRTSWAWLKDTVWSSASWRRGSRRASLRRASIRSATAASSAPASGLIASGRRASSRVWISSASTTWALIRVAIGSVTAGSVTAFLTSDVNRSVLRATWWVQTAIVVTRIVRHARSRTKPDRTRLRPDARGFAATAVDWVIATPPLSIPPSPQVGIVRRNASRRDRLLRVLGVVLGEQAFLVVLLREQEEDDGSADENGDDPGKVRGIGAGQERGLRPGGDGCRVLRVLGRDRF